MQETIINRSWIVLDGHVVLAVDCIAGFRRYGSGLGEGIRTEVFLTGGQSVHVNATVEQVKRAVENS